MAKKITAYGILALVAAAVLGYLLRLIAQNNMTEAIRGNAWALWKPAIFLSADTYFYGAIALSFW